MDIKTLCNQIVKNHPELKELGDFDKKEFFEFFGKLFFGIDYNDFVNQLQNVHCENKIDIDNYLNKYLKTVNKNYINITKFMITDFIQYMKKSDIELSKIGPEFINNYFHELYEKGKSQSSARVIFSRLNMFFEFICENNPTGYIRNPFKSVNFSQIEYKPALEQKLPSEADIITIVKSLPKNLSLIVAMTAVKGYSLKDIYEVSFRVEYVEKRDFTSGFFVAYCWAKNKDTFSNIIREDNCEYKVFGFSPVPGKAYGEYINCPKWFNELLFDFCETNHNDKNSYVINSDATTYEMELYYMNMGINLHSYEKSISRLIKTLANEGKISAEYSLKDIRNYGIFNLYKKYYDIEQMQKLQKDSTSKNSKPVSAIEQMQKFLEHSIPGTTIRYLKNLGIDVKG